MLEHLGRHVNGRAHAGPRHFARIPEELGETEVANFENLLVHEDVGGLEIAVDDAELAELFETAGHLADDVEGHFLVDFASHAEALEVSSRAVLHDEIDVVLRVNDFVELDDVGVLKLLHDCDFIVKRLFQVTIAADQLLLHSLYRHLAPFVTHCLVNLAK